MNWVWVALAGFGAATLDAMSGAFAVAVLAMVMASQLRKASAASDAVRVLERRLEMQTDLVHALLERIVALEAGRAERGAAGESAVPAATQPAEPSVAQERAPSDELAPSLPELPTPAPILAAPVAAAPSEPLAPPPPFAPEPPLVPPASRVSAPGLPPRPETPPELDPLTRVLQAAWSWLLGGNTVARAGVVVLVIGVGLLVKYAADHALFPLELRLAAAALIGLGLALFGFRVRAERPGFSLALQGGGIASTYLVVFFAYRAHGLLPAPVAFATLVLLGVAHVVLSVLQRAESLALVGMLGGFLAPVLASRGGGSHIGLFAYYALLNAGIFAIAWFRAFRWLNLLGFVCTFGIGTAWGVLRYEPEHLPSAGGFLILFFLYYSLTGVLFAWRQPSARRGFVSASLTFGTPLAVFGIMTGLLHPIPYGVALGTAAMGAYYVSLALLLRKLAPGLLAAQVEASVAVGLGFLTLAIPFALDDHHVTGLAWAAEATGLFWLGCRQAKLRTRLFAYLMLFASAVAIAFADLTHGAATQVLSRAGFAIACWSFSILAARAAALRSLERQLASPVWALGLLFWAAAMHAALVRYLPEPLHKLGFLLLLAASAALLELAGRRLSWSPGRLMSWLSAPSLFLSLMPSFVTRHPGEQAAGIGYLAAFAAALWVGQRSDRAPLEERVEERADLTSWSHYRKGFYAVLAWAFAIFATWEVSHGVARLVPTPPSWAEAAQLLCQLAWITLLAALASRARFPFQRDTESLRWLACGPLALIACLDVLILSETASGATAPLPFLPLVNPLDLASALALLVTFRVARAHYARGVPAALQWSLAALAFVWLNAALARVLTHWSGVPYTPTEFPATSLLESARSIFWTLLGLTAMVTASRKALRALWMVGAGLLALVVIKLFLSDLEQLGTGIKIVTFLAVGGLLIVIGYVAPVPPPRAAQRPVEEH